jgi:hypothetical protein
MKKSILALSLVLLLTVAASSFALAQTGPAFTDADQDGVCDLQGTGECISNGYQTGLNGQNAQARRNAYQSGLTGDFLPGAQMRQNRFADGLGNGFQFGDLDGDGVCDNFVDEDGDGVCDHAGTGMGAMNGMGRGARNGGGQGFGVCADFVDADGDGVCDNAGTGMGYGGGGNGRRGFQSQQNAGMGNRFQNQPAN